jgi:hypothetical protein
MGNVPVAGVVVEKVFTWFYGILSPLFRIPKLNL